MVVAAPAHADIARLVRRALEEDIGSGDLTANLIDPGQPLTTRVVLREEAVFCGRPWFEEVFAQLGGRVNLHWHCADADLLTADSVVCTLQGPATDILSGERSALNFIQSLSATASTTRRYVQLIEDLPTRVLDTRKTIPGLRQAQKYAVRCGGGHNHRMGLFDAILIKENHISAAGSIHAAVTRARTRYPDVLCEVEVENLRELTEAIEAGAQRALLDNFSLENLAAGVALTAGRMELEASGDVTLDSIRRIAETGVDFVSTGSITKHLRAIDFSMRFVT